MENQEYVVDELKPNCLRFSKDDRVLDNFDHMVACDEDDLYHTTTGNTHLRKYNIASKTSTELEVINVPQNLGHMARVLNGKNLMAYGGTGVRKEIVHSNELYQCHLGEGRHFTKIETTGLKPKELFGQAVLLNGNYFYTIGGRFHDEYFLDVHRLDMRSNIWEELYLSKEGVGPVGRSSHVIVLVGRKIYILGGYNPNLHLLTTEEITLFDLDTMVWGVQNTKPDVIHGYPTLRSGHIVFSYELQYSFYIFGGIYNASRDILWWFDISDMSWKSVRFESERSCVSSCNTCITPNGKIISFAYVDNTKVLLTGLIGR